ncbi:hypothetical protein SUGI_1238960 [Cryptomeria japonica]|uniref:Uncharacterized protein n=1 Tax=Cryptomeria japonica TaxID=3369 RepID=A0AAD3NS73_CRYJA|nr:hypothetical protein SUGI_1238960 [Cryptomeria japonica]
MTSETNGGPSTKGTTPIKSFKLSLLDSDSLPIMNSSWFEARVLDSVLGKDGVKGGAATFQPVDASTTIAHSSKFLQSGVQAQIADSDIKLKKNEEKIEHR